MEIVKKPPAVIALGMFDGVHLGHRALFHRTIELAKIKNAIPIVFTFYNHPMTAFGKTPEILTFPQEKRNIIQRLGLVPHMIPFSQELADYLPEDFVALIESDYDVRGAVVGFNYRFGREALGDARILAQLLRPHHAVVEVVEPVDYKDERVSSTRIRRLIRAGEMQEANVMLVDPYTLWGLVKTHARIGRKIGYPTANIDPNGKTMPPNGVYVSRVVVNGDKYSAVTSIGKRPTVEEKGKIIIESHLLAHNIDLYDQNIGVELLSFIRNERRFGSLEDITKQIEIDCQTAKKFHQENEMLKK